ncbi:MAG TPA: 50S ribosomal protein L29 [Candidatus Elarobacter sp.]|nr:50S ribosomal protein L29 [Candidatus Elarobacter sp.]
MDVEKLRSLTDAELLHQQQEFNDQLFRLKFQLKMGQTESLTKIRGLRKDVARIHTVIREKELGIEAPSNGHKAEAAGDAEPKSTKATVGKSAKKKKNSKTTVKGKTAKPAKKKTTAAAKKRKK